MTWNAIGHGHIYELRGIERLNRLVRLGRSSVLWLDRLKDALVLSGKKAEREGDVSAGRLEDLPIACGRIRRPSKAARASR